MQVPAQITQWLRETYPKPSVDPEWLEACYTWIIDELHVTPNRTEEIKRNIEAQLLQSNLSDSMLPGTGLPGNVGTMADSRIAVGARGAVLCQITALTEIGHSAFSLHNVRQARIDKADLAGLAGDEDDGEDHAIPNYPRSMLRFQLSDGLTTLNAIEYKRLPQLKLDETPLGYKMILKNVRVRNGIAFLEPDNVILKGHCNEELDENRDRDFVRGLNLRLGRPDEDEGDDENDENNENAPPRPPPTQAAPRQPFQELDEGDVAHRGSPPPADVLEQPRRRSIQSPYFDNPPPAATRELSGVQLQPLRAREPSAAETTTTAERASTPDTYFSEDLPDEFFQAAESIEQQVQEQRQAEIAARPRAGPARAAAGQPPAAEVIMIDDDEDEYDKENDIPVPTRRVRPRMAQRSDEVIDISD